MMRTVTVILRQNRTKVENRKAESKNEQEMSLFINARQGERGGRGEK